MIFFKLKLFLVGLLVVFSTAHEPLGQKVLFDIFDQMEGDNVTNGLYSAFKNTPATICWNKIITINNYVDGGFDAFVEHSISLEISEADSTISSDGPVETVEVFNECSKKFDDILFAVVFQNDTVTVKENRSVVCKSESSYSQTLMQYSGRKRVEVKIKTVLNKNDIDIGTGNISLDTTDRVTARTLLNTENVTYEEDLEPTESSNLYESISPTSEDTTTKTTDYPTINRNIVSAYDTDYVTTITRNDADYVTSRTRNDEDYVTSITGNEETTLLNPSLAAVEPGLPVTPQLPQAEIVQTKFSGLESTQSEPSSPISLDSAEEANEPYSEVESPPETRHISCANSSIITIKLNLSIADQLVENELKVDLSDLLNDIDNPPSAQKALALLVKKYYGHLISKYKTCLLGKNIEKLAKKKNSILNLEEDEPEALSSRSLPGSLQNDIVYPNYPENSAPFGQHLRRYYKGQNGKYYIIPYRGLMQNDDSNKEASLLPSFPSKLLTRLLNIL